MSHELTINKNGQVEFAYLRSDGNAWHGLGQALEDDATHDEWLQASGMNWRVLRSKVRYATERGEGPSTFREMPEQHVLFRSDDKRPLGVVSDRYKVVHPGEVLEFFRDIVRVGGLELSAAGTVFGGKRFWATARIGEASPLSVKDRIKGYLLLSTSADGTLATTVRKTSVRVVCRNTLAMAMGDAAVVKVSHRSQFDPDSVKAEMGLNEAAWEAFRHNIVRLANVSIPVDQAEHMTQTLLGGDAKVVTSAGYNKILDLFKGAGQGANLDGVAGTAWGWVNGVTEYVDHWARARSNENRFVSSQWGPGAAMKSRAMDMALALAA